MFVIEIQARHSPVGNRGSRLFNKVFGHSIAIKDHDTVSFRIFHPVSEDGRSFFQVPELSEAFSQTVAVKDVVSEDEA